MFWKKKEPKVQEPPQKEIMANQTTKEEPQVTLSKDQEADLIRRAREKQKKESKEPSKRDLLTTRIAGEVEQLAPGQSLIYKLPEYYHSGFAAFLIAEPNPTYPKNGKKYIMLTDRIADGKPAGKKASVMQTNKPTDFAQWVAERDGSYGSIERFQE